MVDSIRGTESSFKGDSRCNRTDDAIHRLSWIESSRYVTVRAFLVPIVGEWKFRSAFDPWL